MKTTNELKKAIQMAMYQNNVTESLSETTIICIGDWVGENGELSTFRQIDIAITRYNITKLIVRISEKQYTERFRLHNVYNIDSFITSGELIRIESAISDISNCLHGKYAD